MVNNLLGSTFSKNIVPDGRLSSSQQLGGNIRKYGGWADKFSINETTVGPQFLIKMVLYYENFQI
jgi:hypothetical protein